MYVINVLLQTLCFINMSSEATNAFFQIEKKGEKEKRQSDRRERERYRLQRVRERAGEIKRK